MPLAPSPIAPRRVLLIVDGGELMACSDCCGGLADAPSLGGAPPPDGQSGKEAIRRVYARLQTRSDVAVDVVDLRNLFYLLPVLIRRMGLWHGLTTWLTLRAPAVIVDQHRCLNGLDELNQDPDLDLDPMNRILDGAHEP